MRTEGPFLKTLLSGYLDPIVFDAAMGMGCESIWLTKCGYRVVGNEISPDLREVCFQRASRAGIVLNHTCHNWLDLEKNLGRASFDVVLLLGNSLSLLEDPTERSDAARNLRAIVKPGGVLVVDERNFAYIRRCRADILQGRFRYSGRVIYCGKSVIGRPISIDDDRVTFGYFEKRTNGLIGELSMYPFQEGELVELFKETGFTRATRFSDLEAGVKDDADFYSYVLG
jgi:SAM-dependent methyltransferase